MLNYVPIKGSYQLTVIIS